MALCADHQEVSGNVERLIPTTLVDSYPQPAWLVDKEILLSSGPPRVRMEKVWRVPGALL